MSSLLSNLVDNLSDGRHGHKCMDCKSYLDYISVKNNWLAFRFFECKKIITKPLIKNVLKDLRIYEFTKALTNLVMETLYNEFILMLRKGFYAHKYMGSWERFDETYRSLNMEDITDVHCRYVRRVFKNVDIKNLGNYLDLYIQSDTFLLDNVSKNFKNKCIEIYKLDPDHFLSAPLLAWHWNY